MLATYPHPAPVVRAHHTGLGDASSPPDPNAWTAHRVLVDAAPIVVFGTLGAAFGYVHNKMGMGAAVGSAIGAVFTLYNESVRATAP